LGFKVCDYEREGSREKVMIRPAGKREMVGKEGEGLESELKERSLPNCTIVVTGPPLCSMGEELPHIGT
jgi:hypothetical protein